MHFIAKTDYNHINYTVYQLILQLDDFSKISPNLAFQPVGLLEIEYLSLGNAGICFLCATSKAADKLAFED